MWFDNDWKVDIVVWCPQGNIDEAIDYLKKFDFSGKIVVDTTNIVYKVKDKESFIGKESSVEKVSIQFNDLISFGLQNQKVAPLARWVAGIKTFPHPELLQENPQSVATFHSDDKDALDKVVELFKSTNIKIGTTGPLVGARDDEAFLWKKIQEMVS